MEGGYDLEALAHGWCNVARALLGSDELSDPYGAPPPGASRQDIGRVIAEAKRIHDL